MQLERTQAVSLCVAWKRSVEEGDAWREKRKRSLSLKEKKQQIFNLLWRVWGRGWSLGFGVVSDLACHMLTAVEETQSSMASNPDIITINTL
jgi:hypothetical protein